MSRCWLLLLLFLGSGMLAPAVDAGEDEEFVSLERPVVEIQKIGERCPVRVKLPLPELELGARPKMLGIPARYIHCKGVRIQRVDVRARPGRMTGALLGASAWVEAPKGPDSSARLDYDLVRADGTTDSKVQYLELDEGELNWGDGVRFWLPEESDLQGLRLRLQLTTPADK